MGKSIVRAEVDSAALNKLVTELKQIEPGLAKQLTKDLKAEMLPVAARIQLFMPTTAPLSGMNAENRLGFSAIKVGASAVPGARWGKPFAKFTTTGKGEALASVIENAGRKTAGKTAAGRAMISGLEADSPLGNGKSGRFFFKGYLKNKAGLLDAVQKILDRYTNMTNRRLN